MPRLSGSLRETGYLESLARQDTLVHGLDARSKVVTTLLFVVTVVSFPPYAVSQMVPLLVFPFFLMLSGNIPARYLGGKLLLLSPFAVLVGIFNPLIDTDPVMQLGSIPISGGWLSFCSLLLRYVLTASAALLLVTVTGFVPLCQGLQRLGVPEILSVQLLLLFRYLFVLVQESVRVLRAYRLRSFQRGAMPFRTYVYLVGRLFNRTLDRAQRIYMAMLCHGFQGHFFLLNPGRIGPSDWIFTGTWFVFFIFVRTVNFPAFIGRYCIRLIA